MSGNRTCAINRRRNKDEFYFDRRARKNYWLWSESFRKKRFCHVSKSQLLGEEGKGFAIAMAGLDGGRIGMASQAVGLAESCIAESVEYSTQRVPFGKPVNANQGLQWYLADMATKTEAAKALTLNAAALRQAGKNITKEVAMAKYYASETAVEVANKALQIHGGYGYMKE